MDNLGIYNASRCVPKEALKEIQAGRLKGKSDINPMWRIKALTEQFGPCGIGWKYVITKQWLEVGAKDEVSAFVNIDLFIKVGDVWSEAIPGTGGSAFVALERNGLYTSDECFKMALTDAISVSCKALGFGADVYWSADSTKYSRQTNSPQAPAQQPTPPPATTKASDMQIKRLFATIRDKSIPEQMLRDKMKADYGKDSTKELTSKEVSALIIWAAEQQAG